MCVCAPLPPAPNKDDVYNLYGGLVHCDPCAMESAITIIGLDDQLTGALGGC